MFCIHHSHFQKCYQIIHPIGLTHEKNACYVIPVVLTAIFFYLNFIAFSIIILIVFLMQNNRTSQLKYSQNHYEETPIQYQSVRVPQLKQEPMFVEDKKLYPSQASPNSVLESRSSSSNSSKGVSFGIEISIPVRTRSKRLRPTTNPWLLSPITMFPNKDKKRKKPTQRPFIMETKRSEEISDDVGVKKCAHCEITKTPQWREGPTGPKTLCNACGVRYRSGRLYPEYRPAASPTFVPALHSNSHRKVIEMRQKTYSYK